MWVFALLVVGLVVAAAVLLRELSRARISLETRRRLSLALRVLTEGTLPALAPERAEPAPPPARAWCCGGVGTGDDAACVPDAWERYRPVRSTILPAPRRADPSDEAGTTRRSSWPGIPVRAESYPKAPPLPRELCGGVVDEADDGSVELDLAALDDVEDWVDTQPSLVLTPFEAETLLAAAAGFGDATSAEAHDARRSRPDEPAPIRAAAPLPPAAPSARARGSQTGSRKSALPLPPSSRGGWDQRATQPKPVLPLDDILQEAPTGRGLLVRDDAAALDPDDTQPRRALAG